MQQTVIAGLVCIPLAFALAKVQYFAAKPNLGAKWNGFGAIHGVLDRSSSAPMRYRVLAALLLGRGVTVNSYEAFQLAMLWAVLFSLYLAWGWVVMLLSAVLLAGTFWYDYWDWAGELIGLSLALVSFPAALVGVIIHGFSRETAFLCGFVYALHSGDWIGGAALVAIAIGIMAAVRLAQGGTKLYCNRWMYKVNLDMLLHPGKEVAFPQPQYLSVGLCALALAEAWGRLDGLVVPVLAGAGWLMAKGNETRVFAGVVPYAAAFLAGVVA